MLISSDTSKNVAQISIEQLLAAYRWMVLGRVLDEKTASLYRAGRIPGGAFLGLGQEALSVSGALALSKGDVYAPLIRDAAGRLAFGETPHEALQTCLGTRTGPMRGRDGNVHRGRPREGYLPMISHLGATLSVVNGMLMARRMDGDSQSVGLVSIGEGGTSTGAFHEALNQAAVERLPLVVVVADNQFAYSTPSEKQFACESLAERGRGYGVRSATVKGNALDACMNTLFDAVNRARQGGGPQLVVASLLRLCGHGEHDDSEYVPDKLRESDLGRDCVEVAREQIESCGWLSAAEIEAIWTKAHKTVDDAANQVKQEALPDPASEDWCPLASRHLMDTFPKVDDDPETDAAPNP